MPPRPPHADRTASHRLQPVTASRPESNRQTHPSPSSHAGRRPAEWRRDDDRRTRHGDNRLAEREARRAQLAREPSRPAPPNAAREDALERELKRTPWIPAPDSHPSALVDRLHWFREAARRSPLLWTLAAVVLLQGIIIALWLWPSPSSASAAAPTGESAVAITSQPSGAAVLIDDVARGLTPLTVALEPGVYNITVGLDGALRSRSVDVRAGRETTAHFDLGPAAAAAAPPEPAAVPTGTLNVETNPAGAQVFVDERARGASPVTVRNLEAGTHVVTVRDASRSVSQRVNVIDGGIATVVIALGARATTTSGSLAVTSAIPVQIREHGSLLGTSGPSPLALPAGRHTLEFTNPELKYRVERTVDIQANRRTAIELAVPEGVLNINAIPWAEVFLGSRALGETPIANARVPLGTHELVFRHPELGEQRQTVVVTAGTAVRVGVDLRKGPPQ